MTEKKNYARYLARSTAWVFFFSVVGLILSYFFKIYLARTLTVEDFGLFYGVMAFTGLFVLWKDLGLGGGLVKYIPEFLANKEYGKIKASILYVALVQSIAAVILASFLWLSAETAAMEVFKTPKAIPIIKIIAVSFFTSVFITIFQPVFSGFQKMKFYALVEPIRLLIVLSVSLMLVPSQGVQGAAWAVLFASILSPLVYAFLFLRVFPDFLKVKAVFSRDTLKKISFFGGAILLGSVGSIIIGRIDTIMITYFMTLKDAGIYQIAHPTSQLIFFFSSSLPVVLFPLVSGLYAKNEVEKISRINRISLKFTLLLTTPALVYMIVFSDFIINVLFSAKYAEAVPILQVLAVGAFFTGLMSLFTQTISGIGKPIINSIIVTAIAVLNVVMNLFLIPQFGVMGASYSLVVSYALGFTLAFLYVRKEIGMRFPLFDAVKVSLCSLVLFLLLSYLKGFTSEMAGFVAVSVIGAVLYASLVFLSGILSKEDVDIMESIGAPKQIVEVLKRAVKKD